MRIGIMVNEGPYTHQASDTAFQFAKAAINKGHQIQRVFFYHDGVYNASRLIEPPQDDRHISNRWRELAKDNQFELFICVAAALRRGIKEENLQVGFQITGLGRLVEMGIESDRLVVFGD